MLIVVQAMFQPWEQQAAGYPEPGRMPAHMAWGHHPAHHPAAHGHAHPARGLFAPFQLFDFCTILIVFSSLGAQ